MKLTNKLPRLLGSLMFVVGFFNVAANIFHPFKHAAHRIDSYTLVYVNSTAFSTSLISGMLLILISGGLRKRKRRAWNLAVILLAIAFDANDFAARDQEQRRSQGSRDAGIGRPDTGSAQSDHERHSLVV